MDEQLQWLVYNVIMFGSLYAFSKMIEHYTWHVIENYEKYAQLLNKWRN